MRSDTSLDGLHQILQLAMGWSDGHLHEFIANGVGFGVVDDHWSEDVKDERETCLAEVVAVPGDHLLHLHDFGDGWECDVSVEEVLDPQRGLEYPLCVKGRRAGPPEDVGGVWGYADFLAARADPKHPEHKRYLEWAGGQFNPEEFDPARVNSLLRQFP